MKTFIQKEENKQEKWYLVDATGMPLGRLASGVASILRGKNDVDFTPHVDSANHVIVINTDKIVLTGKKVEQKYYRYHTLYIGGLKEIQYKDLLAKKSDFAVYEAIRGMLPKNRLGRKMIKHVRVYKDDVHGHDAQKPEKIELKGKRV